MQPGTGTQPTRLGLVSDSLLTGLMTTGLVSDSVVRGFMTTGLGSDSVLKGLIADVSNGRRFHTTGKNSFVIDAPPEGEFSHVLLVCAGNDCVKSGRRPKQEAGQPILDAMELCFATWRQRGVNVRVRRSAMVDERVGAPTTRCGQMDDKR